MKLRDILRRSEDLSKKEISSWTPGDIKSDHELQAEAEAIVGEVGKLSSSLSSASDEVWRVYDAAMSFDKVAREFTEATLHLEKLEELDRDAKEGSKGRDTIRKQAKEIGDMMRGLEELLDDAEKSLNDALTGYKGL